MSDFMRKVMSDDISGQPSAKRWTLVYATVFMGLSLIIMSVAFVLGKSVPAEVFWAFTVPLSLMAGASYSTVEIAKVRGLASSATGLVDALKGNKNQTEDAPTEDEQK